MNEQYLQHYGVKGMKWGVRRKTESKSAHNKNYTDKQRKNDRAFYGNRGEKRINKKLNEGYGLRGARHFEVERKERQENAKKTAKRVARKGAKAATKAAKVVGGYMLYDQFFWGGAGRKAVTKAAKTAGRVAVTAVLKMRGADYVRWYN